MRFNLPFKLTKKNIIIISAAAAVLLGVIITAIILLSSGKESGGCEHTYNEITVKEATCTEGGIAYDECSKCGDKSDEREIPTTRHRMEELLTPATCTEEGRMLIGCADCDHTESEVIPVNGHSFSGGATCTEDAVCSDCGYVSEATGHTNPKYPSCTEKGTCRKCGEAIAEPRGHTEPFGATCQRGGACIWCDEVVGEPIPHINECAEGAVEGVCTRCEQDVGIPIKHRYSTYDRICPRCEKKDPTYYVNSDMGSSFELKHEDAHYRITLVKLEKDGTWTYTDDYNDITIKADRYYLHFTVENLGSRDSSADRFIILSDYPCDSEKDTVYLGNYTSTLEMCVLGGIDYDDVERRDGVVKPGEVRNAKMDISGVNSGIYKVEFKLTELSEDGTTIRSLDSVCLEYDLVLNEYIVSQ